MSLRMSGKAMAKEQLKKKNIFLRGGNSHNTIKGKEAKPLLKKKKQASWEAMQRRVHGCSATKNML